MVHHTTRTVAFSPIRAVPSTGISRVVMPPSRSRRAVRRRHLRSALLIVVALLSTMLGYFGYGADVSGRGLYEIAIGTLWVCWFGLPYLATTYATWRLGPPRLVQPRLARSSPSTAVVCFRNGLVPSLN